MAFRSLSSPRVFYWAWQPFPSWIESFALHIRLPGSRNRQTILWLASVNWSPVVPKDERIDIMDEIREDLRHLIYHVRDSKIYSELVIGQW